MKNSFVEFEYSRRVLNEMNGTNIADVRTEVVDPGTALLIAKLGIYAIRAVKKCKNSREEREDAIRNPSSKDVGILKRVIRKKLGFFRYMIMGIKLLRAMRKIGHAMSDDDLVKADLHRSDSPDMIIDGQEYYEVSF